MARDIVDTEMICAAILTGAFICNQRQALTSGVVDNTIREKFPEYLQLVRETAAVLAPNTEGTE